MEDSEIFHDTYQEFWEIDQKFNQVPSIQNETDNSIFKTDLHIANNKRSKSNEKNDRILVDIDPNEKNSKSDDFIIQKTDKHEDPLKKSSLKLMIDLNSFMYPSIPLESSLNEKIKIFLKNKNSNDVNNLRCVQNFYQEKKNCPELLNVKINTHKSKPVKNLIENCIWVIKFSFNGEYMATGGSDAILRVYEINKNEETLELINLNCFIQKFHQSDIVDLAWNFNSTKILTCSMDFKVILWERHNPVPLKIFQHFDIITCCIFNPEDENTFYTGSFDKILRLWDIASEKVITYAHTPDFITSMAFSPNRSMLVLGFVQGCARIYKIINKKIELITEIQCKNKRKNLMKSKGKKITNIQFIDNQYFLVTTNDSRIRLIDTSNFQQILKYKGFKNERFHIKSDYCYEREMILSGSEDGKAYLWNKISDYIPIVNPRYVKQKMGRNCSHESFIPFDKDIAICGVFAPIQLYEIFKKKLMKQNKEIFCDLLFLLVSNKSQYKIYANLIGI